MSLANQAVIVRLSVELFPQATTDKGVTTEVNNRKKASQRAGRYVKQLFPPESLEHLLRVISGARSTLKRDTVPWDGTGMHLLALKKWDTFNSDMQRLEKDFIEARERFIYEYPQHIEAARARLGDLFSADDYPSDEELRLSCVFRVDYMSVPTTNDIRIGNDTELAQKIVDSMTRAYGSLIDHLAETLYEEVREIHGQMENGERFRVERVERLRETIERVREYNLTKDPRVDEALSVVENRVLAQLDAYVAERGKGGRRKIATTEAFEEAKRSTEAAATDLIAIFHE